MTRRPIACTLAREAQPDRAQAWRAVLGRVESRRASARGIRLRFPRDPDLLATLTALATREVECCSFFTFTLRLDADAAWLTVGAPDDAASLVAQLFGPVDHASG